MNENGANKLIKISITRVLLEWIENLDRELKFWLTFWFFICSSVVIMVFILCFDNFRSSTYHINVLEKTLETEIEKTKIEGKCWQESSLSTGNRQVLFSVCEGKFKINDLTKEKNAR